MEVVVHLLVVGGDMVSSGTGFGNAENKIRPRCWSYLDATK